MHSLCCMCWSSVTKLRIQKQWVRMILSRNQVQFHSSGRSNLESPNLNSSSSNNNAIISPTIHQSWGRRHQGPTCFLRRIRGPGPSGRLRFGLTSGGSTALIACQRVVSSRLCSGDYLAGRWTGSPWLNPITGGTYDGRCLWGSATHR